MNCHIKNNKEFLTNIPNINEEGLILGIILKKIEEFIGWCGTYPKEELPLPNREIFYAISKYHRGKGYSTQVVQGLVKCLFEETQIRDINAIALTHNTPSNRVIEKNGFNYIDIIEIDNEEFKHYKLKEE